MFSSQRVLEGRPTPKPEDNHGFVVSQLAHDTKDNLAVGGKLGPAIHTALNGVQHQPGTNHASDAAVQQLAQLTLPEAANNAAENHLGRFVHGLVQENVPPDGGLGDLISTHVHHWIG